MFELLTRILLWALIGLILWRLFINVIPRIYLTWLGGLLILTFVVLAFIDPTDATVGSVWEILSIPLKPLGFTILLLLSALRSGTKAVVGNQVLTAALVLLLSSLPIVSNFVTAQAEQPAANVTTGPTTSQAIVVLGDSSDLIDTVFRSRTEINNQQGIQANLTARLIYAARLYQEQGNNPLLIVTANLQNRGEDDTNQIQAIRTLLTDSGVPGNRIVIDPEGYNTRSSAREVQSILNERGLDAENARVALVGSALSTRRAAATFSQLGMDPVPRPTDFSIATPIGGNDFQIRISDFIPSVEALALTTRWWEEFLTSVYYFLRGWLASPAGL